MTNKEISDRFNGPIEEARNQALELYQQGWLEYPEYAQIRAHLSNARSFLLVATQRHEEGKAFQGELFDEYVISARK